jgi:hypothetical protein
VENLYKKPKETKSYEIRKQRVRQKGEEEKPLYKMKMFNNVDSKVKQGLNNFKTYTAPKDNIDKLIAKVENELIDLNNN